MNEMLDIYSGIFTVLISNLYMILLVGAMLYILLLKIKNYELTKERDYFKELCNHNDYMWLFRVGGYI